MIHLELIHNNAIYFFDDLCGGIHALLGPAIPISIFAHSRNGFRVY
jgi:hypothetical protein